MLKAVQRTGQPDQAVARHMKRFIPTGDWPTKQAFSREFMNHAERIAARLNLTGWHQMNASDWQACAEHARGISLCR